MVNQDAEQGSRVRVALVGFMGSGKSTIGRLSAAQLDLEFVDLDTEIVRARGLPISEIFRRDGETVFRDLESATLEAILERSRVLVATGGGVPEAEANRELLQSRCLTLFLHVSFEEAIRRVSGDGGRPLLEMPRETLRQRFEDRQPLYASCGPRLDVDSGSVVEAVEQVVTAVRRAWPAARTLGRA